LKIETQILEDHQARITVEFEPEILTAAKKRAAQKIAKQMRFPGFRPGKAPYNVVLRGVGEGAITEQAMELIVEENYPKILDETNLNPYGPGSLEKIVSIEPPICKFMIPLAAEVTLGDYRSLRFPYEVPVVSEEDVDKVIQNLRERRSTRQPVERPIQLTDDVSVVLSATTKNPAEGEEANFLKERVQTVIVREIDETNPYEWPFAGFSINLLGSTIGDEKAIEYTYPEDYIYDVYRGKQVEFKVKVEGIKEQVLPELNDEFAKSVGDFADVAALRAQIRENLETQKTSQSEDEYNETIIGALVEQTSAKFCPQMLDNEIHTIIDEVSVRMEQRGTDLETYLKSQNKTIESYHEDIKPSAIMRLKRTLALMELAKQEKVRVSQEAVSRETAQTLTRLGENASKKEMRQLSSQDFITHLVRDISSNLLIQQTMGLLRSIAKGENTLPAEPPPDAAAPLGGDPTPEAETPLEAENAPTADLPEAADSPTV
jgi:trigger factor